MPTFVHSFLDSATALDAFVADWHGHRLPREAWTHGAHVGVCAYYAFDHDEEATLAIMRPGIRTFNESVGGQNTATSGYHESCHAALGNGHCGPPSRESGADPMGGRALRRRAVHESWRVTAAVLQLRRHRRHPRAG